MITLAALYATYRQYSTALANSLSTLIQEDFEMATVTKLVAKDVVNQVFVDAVGSDSATIEFKEIYQKIDNEMLKVNGKVLMRVTFDQSGKDVVKESVLSETYVFVPNSNIDAIAAEIPGSTVSTNFFGMHYFGHVESADGLRVAVSNSYGGVRAFEMSPTAKIRGEYVPVFLKLRQIHSGTLDTFEFQMKESLAVSRALRDGQHSIEVILSEEMTKKEEEYLDKLILESRMPKKITEEYLSRRGALINPIKSFADAILFLVDEIKTYGSTKKFSVGVQLFGEKLITDILSRSKAAAIILDAVGTAERELAADGAGEIQSTVKTSKARFRV